MIFEWDEGKRLAARGARGLDFVDATLFFDGRPVILIPSPRAGGAMEDDGDCREVYFTLVWMWRGEAVRVISMRRAHEGEERAMNLVTTELPAVRRKASASLRLDADMLEWFQSQGRGYEVKINEVLRSYYERHTR